MRNQVIEVLDKEHGKRVIEYWESKGIYTCNLLGIRTKKGGDLYRYYGVIDGYFNVYSEEQVVANNAEIIQLSTESPKEEKTFPRVMLVSDDAVVWNQSVVECLRGGYAFAAINYSSVEEYENTLKRGASVPFFFWKYHKELSDGNKVSKAKIAEMFGIEPEQLEIVE